MDWISVSERLPDNERVLAFIPERGYFIAEHLEFSGNNIHVEGWIDEIGAVTGITHWMHLPEEPKL